MNTHDMNTKNHPLDFWLKTVDRLVAAEFARAFESEGAGRRDWRLLNAVDGTVAPRRPLSGHRLRRLLERGWVAQTDEGFALTDDGRAAKKRLGEAVAGIRSRVTEAVQAEDLATTLATLEQIARAFGWSEGMRLPRAGKGRGRGFHGHGRSRHGFGRREGFGPRDNFSSECDGRDDGERHGWRDDRHGFGPRGGGHYGRGHHGRGHSAMKVAHFGQRSYERGFEAGFARGRDA